MLCIPRCRRQRRMNVRNREAVAYVGISFDWNVSVRRIIAGALEYTICLKKLREFGIECNVYDFTVCQLCSFILPKIKSQIAFSPRPDK